MSLVMQRKDLEDCPKCKERTLFRIDRWGVVKKECLNCDHEEIIELSWKNPEHKPTARRMF